MMSLRSYFFYILVFFFFCIGFVFNSIHPIVDSIVILAVLISIIGSFLRVPQLPIVKKFNILIPFFLFFLIVAGFNEKVNYNYLLVYIFKALKILFVLYASNVIVVSLNKYKVNLTKTVLNLIFISIFINALVLVVMMNNSGLRDFIYSYTTKGEFRSSFDLNYRMGGLTGTTGGSVLSVVQSIGVVMTPVLLRINKNKLTKISLLASSVFIFYSILIVGRSGLWSVIVFLPLMVFLINGKVFLFAFFKLVVFILFGILIFALILQFINASDLQSEFIISLNRTFDTFLNFNKTGNFKDYTFYTLLNHILFPNDLKTLLVGDAEHLFFTQFDRSLDSDIGYIRNIWSYGLIGAFIYLLPLFTVAKKIIRNKMGLLEGKLLFIITLIMLVFHAKENYAYTRMLFSIFSIILVLNFRNRQTLK